MKYRRLVVTECSGPEMLHIIEDDLRPLAAHPRAVIAMCSVIEPCARQVHRRSAPYTCIMRELFQFAGAIPRSDVALMQEVIEQGCEQVDTDEW